MFLSYFLCVPGLFLSFLSLNIIHFQDPGKYYFLYEALTNRAGNPVNGFPSMLP
jgi:hypothetical protein